MRLQSFIESDNKSEGVILSPHFFELCEARHCHKIFLENYNSLGKKKSFSLCFVKLDVSGFLDV